MRRRTLRASDAALDGIGVGVGIGIGAVVRVGSGFLGSGSMATDDRRRPTTTDDD